MQPAKQPAKISEVSNETMGKAIMSLEPGGKHTHLPDLHITYHTISDLAECDTMWTKDLDFSVPPLSELG
jgi:hypothetical protein